MCLFAIVALRKRRVSLENLVRLATAQRSHDPTLCFEKSSIRVFGLDKSPKQGGSKLLPGHLNIFISEAAWQNWFEFSRE